MQHCSHFGSGNLSHSLPSLLYQVLIYTESSEACEGEKPEAQHRNNDAPTLRWEKCDISLKILHQAGIELAWQAVLLQSATLLTIVQCPSHVTQHMAQLWLKVGIY